jgi:hypothetical protein
MENDHPHHPLIAGLVAGLGTLAWPDAIALGWRLLGSLLSAVIAGFGYKLGTWLWKKVSHGQLEP